MLEINIYLNDEHYGSRFWAVVPRVGDYIKLGGHKEGVYKVNKIIWSGDTSPYVILTVENEPEAEE